MQAGALAPPDLSDAVCCDQQRQLALLSAPPSASEPLLCGDLLSMLGFACQDPTTELLGESLR